MLDSPFVDLEQSVTFLTKKKLNLPSIITSFLLTFVRPKINDKVGFDVLGIKLHNIIKNIQVPTTLIASNNDDLVPYKHFEFIMKNYGTKDIQLQKTEKGHSEFRETNILAESFARMVEKLIINDGDIRDITFKAFNADYASNNIHGYELNTAFEILAKNP